MELRLNSLKSTTEIKHINKNRTIVELRLKFHFSVHLHHFHKNRTIVELRQFFLILSSPHLLVYKNRTIVELRLFEFSVLS